MGLLISNVDFKDLGLTLQAADPVTGKAPVVLSYGQFLQNSFDFLIIAFVIFLMIRTLNKFAPKPDPAPKGPSQEQLLAEIRDLLKKQTPKGK